MSKDELSAFWEKASKEKKDLEEEFDAGFEVIFNNGYGCCAFAHNIYRSKPRISAGMPDKSNSLPPEFLLSILIATQVLPSEFLSPILT